MNNNDILNGGSEDREYALVDMDVSAIELGAFLDISARRVQQLSREGVIRKIAHGRYPLLGALHAYLDYLRTTISIFTGSASEKGSRRRFLAYLNDEERRPPEDIEATMSKVKKDIEEIFRQQRKSKNLRIRI